MDEPLPRGCHVDAWRPAVPGVSEVFHARIAGYRYPAHCHDTWAVLIVDAGAIQYDLDVRNHDALTETVSILPPGVVHNGYPAWRAGSFRKRVVYLDEGFLPARLVGQAVDVSTFRDAGLRAAVSGLHDILRKPGTLDAQTRLAMIAERFERHLAPRPIEPAEPEHGLAERLRDYLDGHLTGDVTLAAAALSFGRSVPHVIRSFTARYRISPHAYVVGARIEAARKLLLQGVPAARVAAETGFHDQAHLTRHFKRHVSVTPGSYAGRTALR